MRPLNNHVKVEPIEYEGFIASQKGQYEEMGRVIEAQPGLNLPAGSIVYFDAWLAKKYPVKGEVGKYVWFVKYEDIVAYEPLSE